MNFAEHSNHRFLLAAALLVTIPLNLFSQNDQYSVSIRYTGMELINDSGELARVSATTATDPVAVIDRRLGSQMSNNFSNFLTRDSVTLAEGSVNNNYLGLDDFNESDDFMLSWVSQEDEIDFAVNAGGGILRDGTYVQIDSGSYSTHLQALGDGGHIVGFRHATGLGHRGLSPIDFTTVDFYTITAIAVRPDNTLIEVPHPSGNGYGFVQEQDGSFVVTKDNEASLHGVNSSGIAVGSATEQVNLFLDTWVKQTYSFTYNINTGETKKLPLLFGGGSDINDFGVVVGHHVESNRSWIYNEGDDTPTIMRNNYRVGFGNPGPKINNRGQVFWPLASDTLYWEEGELKDVNNLTDEVSVRRVVDVNRVGQILVQVDDFSLRILSPSPLSLSVDPAPRILKIGETYVLKVHLDHSLTEPATYRFKTGQLEFDPDFFEFFDANDTEIELPEGQLLIDPGPILLDTTDSSYTFDLPVVPIKNGATRVTSEVEVTLAGGDIQVIPVTLDLLIEPIRAEFNIVESKWLLNQTQEEDWGEKAKKVQADRLRDIADGTARAFFTGSSDAPEPFTNLLEVELELTNTTDQNVTNLSIPAAIENILSLIKSRDPDSLGVPLFPVRFIGPNGEIDDLTTSAGNLDLPLQTIEGGESVTFTWVFEAYDANSNPEIDDSANLVFEPIVLGTFPGEGDLPDLEIRLLLESEIDVIDKPLLKWGILPRDGRTDYLSGQAVKVDGFIENVSTEGGNPPRDLLVMVYPVQEGNLGGGFTKRADDTEFPNYYEIFQLPADGPDSRMDISTAFASFPTAKPRPGNKPSPAKVRFGVRLWIKNSDDSVTSADGQVILDPLWVDEFSVTLRPNRKLLTAAQQRRQECIQLGIWPFVCGFDEGIVDFTNGMYGLGKFLISTAEANLNLYRGIIAYEMLAMKSLFDAAQGNPDALDELYRESYEKYTELVNLGVMVGEGIGNVPMGFQAFSIQAGEAMSELFDAAFAGNLEEVEFKIGQFFGANPDLLLEPLMVGVTYSRLVRSASVAEANVVTDLFAAQRRSDAARLSSNIDNRLAVAEANPAITDLSSALFAGDKLNPQQLLKVFGIDELQLKRLQDIAKQNGVMISFRSRARLARDLLERNLAWPKPQGLKFKTVNDIDIKYLGYRNETKAILEIQQPPPSLLNKADDALKDSLDDYMEDLTREFPELGSNDVLAGEVRKRLQTRAEEWNELAPKLNLTDEAASTIDLPTNFEANLQFGLKKERDSLPDIRVEQTRKVRSTPDGTRIDPVSKQAQRRWQLDMSNPDGGDFRPVSGDVDFMAITEPNGSMILDADRRLLVYKQLANAVDMQHGESFTFFIDKARTKYLDGNTFGKPGAEALCTIAPYGDQTPTAAYFVKSLSIMKGGVNALFLPIREVIKKRAKLILDEGRIRFVPGKKIVSRRTDVTGEYVVMAGAYINSLINLDFVNRFKPFILKETLRSTAKRFLFYVPRLISTYSGEEEDPTTIFSRVDEPGAPLPLVQSRGLLTLSLLSAQPPLLQLEIHPETSLITPKVWTEDTGWSFITGDQAIALGEPEVLDMLPMSHLKSSLERGQSEFVPAEMSELEVSGDFFQVGDRIVIAPGSEFQEFATLKSIAPYEFATGVIYEHLPGTLVASLGEDNTDRDEDRLSGSEEVALGTNPNRFDSDGDGVGDGEEFLSGEDALVPSELGLSFFDMGADGRSPSFGWSSLPGYRYLLEGSTDLFAGSWQPLEEFTATDSLPEYTGVDYFPWSDQAFFRLSLLSTDDPDGDGLSIREEIGIGTDPERGDTDGDGVDDGVEQHLNVDPLDPDSIFALTDVNLDLESETMTVQFPSEPGVVYYFESTSDVASGVWNIHETQTAFDIVSSFVVSSDDLGETPFFRVRTEVSTTPVSSF